MDHIRIKVVSEEDFDEVITAAGGSRILEQGSADYRLNEAIIELKLVSEEGFEKTERQKKLANLFRATQPNQPVVLIKPEGLNASDSKSYYRIVEVPIKNACKKASKQLQLTAGRHEQSPVRVLVVLNIGYTLLSPDEFKDVCFKCVRNDTSGIDWLICGGVYFYSDKFDNYVITRFEDFPINLSCSFPSCDVLQEAWGNYLDKLMTDAVRNPAPFCGSRAPVIDLIFELEGVRYVKPSPRMPQSSFWPGGVAPRENTTGINSCPSVAKTFPSLSEGEWKQFKYAMPSARRLKATYRDWLMSYPDESLATIEPLKPLVFVELKFEEFIRWIKKPDGRWLSSDIDDFINEVLQQRVISLLEGVKDKTQTHIIPLDYIHLLVNEVGNDKANDFASIYYVSEVPGFEQNVLLVENAKLFWEHGMAVAAMYAIKRNVSAILFTRNQIR